VIECENDENVIEGVNDFVEVIVYDTLGVWDKLGEIVLVNECDMLKVGE
jgi:hypothetical protein